ncbi:MAG TPA: type III secretion system stator protein SctL [Pyrinomonadaceae bacterium]|nr:type III secretion system stator protein SctL [Pyrinomonadaceae bacterium]
MNPAKIIKTAATNKSGAGSITKRQIVEARVEARRIVAQAESEAAAIRQQAESIAREARDTAYREGSESALLEWQTLLLEAREQREQALAGIERDVLRLAVKIAEKILGRELERDKEAVIDIVATALRQARRNEMITLRVNPNDLPIVEQYRQRFEKTGRNQFLDIVPDPAVTAGGCVIESESGAIDAQLSTQLRVLERAMVMHATGEARSKNHA